MTECIFRLKNNELYIKDSLNKYKINFFLGKGSTSKVYQIENNNEKYVMKMSEHSCKKDLISEVRIFKNYFIKNKINLKILPLFYGNLENTNHYIIIYQYFGRYDLKEFKLKYSNLFSFNNNINIIKQIIEQLISFNNIIHCDLKDTNIIINNDDDTIIATIIDMGLSKLSIIKHDTLACVLSTNYITSPESLLTLEKFNNNLININDLNIKKHDYFGLFCLILNLFLKNTYWDNMYDYLRNELELNINFILSHDSSILYVYIWYKFNNSNYSNNESLKNIILNIESLYPNFKIINFLNFDAFFKKYLLPNLNLDIIDSNNIILLYDFLILLIKFDPFDRPDFETIYNCDFLNKKIDIKTNY